MPMMVPAEAKRRSVGIAARVLPIPHAAHDVIRRPRRGSRRRRIVRVMHGEAAVVEDARWPPAAPRRSASVRISSSAPAAAMSGPQTSKGFSALSSASQIAWITPASGTRPMCGASAAWIRPSTLVALQRGARIRHVDGARRERHRVLERAARDGRDPARVPHFPAPLRDVLHGAHLREAPARHQRAVVAVRSHVAHRRGDDHRRAVEVRVLELAGALPRSRREVHVDEGGLARGLRVAVRGRQHQRLREEQDRLHSRDGQQRVEEAGLRAPGIRERVGHALRDQLVHRAARRPSRTRASFSCPAPRLSLVECVHIPRSDSAIDFRSLGRPGRPGGAPAPPRHTRHPNPAG